MKINYKYGKCSDPECVGEKLIVNKKFNLCWLHESKRKAKLYAERKREKIKNGSIIDKTKLSKFFKEFWRKNKIHICFETNVPIYNYRSWHIHHILEKEKYPQFAFEEWNLVILSLESHSKWHNLTNKDKEIKMPKLWKLTQDIKTKYVKTI